MSYTAISDFKYGMDRRRPQTSGVPGTLWILKNALITRGGDIERAKKFAATHVLPDGTFGAFSVQGQTFVFGAGTTPAGMPTGIRYQQLAAPSAPAMTEVLDAKAFDGKVYSIAAYNDGNVYHYYNGVRVTDWDTLADNAADFTTVASRLAGLIDAENAYDARAFGAVIEITATVPGVAFTISASATDLGPVTTPSATVAVVQANVAAVAEVRATGSITITGGTQSLGVNRFTSVTVAATEMLTAPVDWIDSNDATANALAVEINNGSHGYFASAAGAVVTITAAPTTGAAENGKVIAAVTGGNATYSKVDMAGGVTKVEPVAQVNTVTIGGTGAVAETLATGSITITGGSSSPGVNKINTVVIDSADLITTSVDWSGSNSVTASNLADAINSGTHGFAAAAVGAVVTITAPVDSGAAINGKPITVGVGGTVTVSTVAMSGGVSKITYSQDLWTITLDSNPYKTTGRGSATGTSAYVNQSRVYSTAGSLERYCKINDPTNWTDRKTASGAGFINMSNQAEGVTTLVGTAKYSDNSAIFARNSILVYSLNADATTSQIVQSIDNTGTIAPRSIVAYGANDVFYLDETGIRSLRTRDALNEAYASDVGSAFDTFVQQIIAEVGNKATSKACAVIEARDGRYMLAIGRYILVLSQFPASKVSAWSYIDFGVPITDLIRVDRTIQLRAGNTIYTYGGRTGNEYPLDNEFIIEAETPFISSKDPAGEKELQGFDMAAENEWLVRLALNPNHPAAYVDVGKLKDNTYHQPAIKVPGQTTHFALRMTCSRGGYASLSSTAVHHMKGESQ